MFSTLFKDITGSKPNHGADFEAIDGKAMLEELTKKFAVSNFPTETEVPANVTVEKDNVDLDIGKPCYSVCVKFLDFVHVKLF